MSAAVLEARKETTPSITRPSADMVRMLKVLTAKSGGGSPFEAIALRRDKSHLYADYQTNRRSSGLYVRFDVSTTDEEHTGFIATNDPLRLLDYVDSDGLFGEEPITLSQADNVISISGGRKKATMTAFNAESVPTQTFQDPYGVAQGGFVVNTNPATRPPDGSPWEAWTARGYAVYQIPVKALQSILAAGALIQKRYKAAAITLIGDGTSVSARVQENNDQTADAVDLGELEGVTVVAGSAPIRLSAMYSIVEPLWSSLKNLNSERVVFVHHPSEGRFNIATVEDGIVYTQFAARISEEE